jgi:hypothetical protein
MAVFLSYHNSRLETVEHVAKYLARHQIDAWYAPRDIPSGANWGQAITTAIRQSDALVLLFDLSADTSRHVQREVDLADREGIPIHWLKLEAIEPDNLNYYLGTIQWIDWLDKRDEALERLVRSLPRPSQTPPSPTPAPAAAPVVETPIEQRKTPARYTEWTPRQLPAVTDSSIDEIIDGLVEIVAAEGPILTQRAYRVYVKASGGQRVGKNIEDLLVRATERAVRSGRLAQVKDRLHKEDKTLYLPGTPSAVPRSIGSRTLTEVPRSEIQQLVKTFGLSFDSSGAPRAVAEHFGIKRLSDEAERYVRESLAYRYGAQSEPPSDSGDDEVDLQQCGHDMQRRLRRLQAVLAEATGLAAETYADGATVMFPSDIVAVQRASLFLDGEHIRLGMWPAELAAQYQRVYSDPKKVEALITLAELPGWELNANFHLGFRFSKGPQRWYPPRHLSGQVYVRQWMDDLQDGRAGGRTHDQLRDPVFRQWLTDRGYGKERDLPTLDDWLNERPAGTQLHIRPSVEIRKSWLASDAAGLDSAGTFVDEVREAIDQALIALAEPKLSEGRQSTF